MSLNRKDFLKLSFAGGLGAFFSGMTPASLVEKGARLIPVSRQSLVMGSVVSFEVLAESEKAGNQAINEAIKIFRKVDNIFSMYASDSEMAMLGQNAGNREMELSAEAIEVLGHSKKVYLQSNGLFDITIEPAMKLWGFREDSQNDFNRPTDKQLQELEQLIGSEKLFIEQGKALLKHPGMAIDTGGIAGGYALDRAVELLRSHDISAAFINFSGDIAAFGSPVESKSWKVHILNPQTLEPVSEPVYLQNEALSTSGAYQNRRGEPSGKSWGHLLHPGMSKPIEPVGSITAIAKSAMNADAWSTAAYLGAEVPKGVKTIEL